MGTSKRPNATLCTDSWKKDRETGDGVDSVNRSLGCHSEKQILVHGI